MGIFRKARDIFVLSDFYPALMAALIAPFFYLSFALPFDWLVFTAILFECYLIFALNRLIDREIDAVNAPERTRFLNAHGTFIPVIAAAGFSSTMTLLYSSNVTVFAILLVNFLMSLFYSFPLIPRPLGEMLGFRRFKEALFLKTFSVALMHAIFVLALAADSGFTAPAAVGVTFIYVLMRFFINSTFFDIRDIEGDAKLGITTIPIYLGKERALIYMHYLNLATMLLPLIAYSVSAVPLAFVIFSIAAYAYGLYYITEAQKSKADLKSLVGYYVEGDLLPALAFTALVVFLSPYIPAPGLG
ncbi:MAG: UbiA family prenyltransferase [Candidatus Micrarchaeota archaeon]